MKISKVAAAWFSPTGTTKKCTLAAARAAADVLGAQLAEIDFTLPSARDRAHAFADDELLVIGMPVYAGRLPNLIAPFVRDMFKSSSSPAIPIVCFGNRNFDDALTELRGALEASGFWVPAAAAFSCEHSFSRVLGAGRPDEDDIREAIGLGDRAAHLIAEASAPLPRIAIEGNEPPGPYYTPRDRHGNGIDIRKVKPTTSDACTKCGTCAAVCPMGSIDKDDTSRVTGVCIKCCACEKRCPVGAKGWDDKGYLYHKSELEELYARRAPNRIFF